MASPTTTLDGVWSEFCFITICPQSGTPMSFQAITETVDIDIGDKDFDTVASLSGARLVKFTPQEPTTITFEAYPVEAGTASGSTGKGFFGLMNTEDGTQPLQISVDTIRSKYRVAILWTNDITVTTADTAVASASSGLRIVAADGYITSCKPSFTDNILKWTVTFKVPPFDSSGNANIKVESCDATAALTALASYTSSVKW